MAKQNKGVPDPPSPIRDFGWFAKVFRLQTQPNRQMDPLVAAQQGNTAFIASNPNFRGLTPFFDTLFEQNQKRGPNIVKPTTQPKREMGMHEALQTLQEHFRELAPQQFIKDGKFNVEPYFNAGADIPQEIRAIETEGLRAKGMKTFPGTETPTDISNILQDILKAGTSYKPPQ